MYRISFDIFYDCRKSTAYVKKMKKKVALQTYYKSAYRLKGILLESFAMILKASHRIAVMAFCDHEAEFSSSFTRATLWAGPARMHIPIARNVI